MHEDSLLIGDIGGTNARFALADPLVPGFSMQKTYACANFETANVAIRAYLDAVGSRSPSIICLAAAGPVIDNVVRLTNNSWTIDADELAKDFTGTSVKLLNDFEAIAYSIPFLTPGDSLPLGLAEASAIDEQRYSFGIVGPGTGLGYAALYKREGVLVPITGEGGHQGFAPESQVQLDVLTTLRERYDRVSYERLVSGPGIENIYWALTRIHGEKQTQLSAAEIFSRAENNGDPRAEEAVQLFFELLGQVAGNVAISMSTFDGVYIAGGIAKRHPNMLLRSRFRKGFENKGQHRPLMERIPTRLITHDDPGLLGASYCALEILKNAAS
jgi:glucokinase